jgi:hypothetical protein
VELSVASNVGGLEISDGSRIDNSCRDLTRGDQITCPRCGVGIDVVVQRRGQRFFEDEGAARYPKKA